MQTICQWVLLVFMVLGVFEQVHRSYVGSKAKESTGFRGFIVSLLTISTIVALYYGAGLFSALWGAM